MNLERQSNNVECAKKERPLNLIAPNCYSLLLKELEAFHLHSYDMKAEGSADEKDLTIVLRFGEELGLVRRQQFSRDKLERPDHAVSEFFRDTAEVCKQTLITDYFKMIKP
jgi:hypothetical protein